MRWKDKLTEDELKHLAENGIDTLADVKAMCAHQAWLRTSLERASVEPCRTCRDIAIKLGLLVRS